MTLLRDRHVHKLWCGLGVSLTALACTLAASPALAEGQAGIDQLEDQIKAQEQQLNILQQQMQDLKASQASKYAEQKRATDEMVSLDNGRPTFKKGDFSASLRALVQFDAAYYSNDRRAGTQDLSSGTNFRRARIGLDGQLGQSWNYSFNYDFGGSGTEGSTISSAYLQYSGIQPVTFRFGAFSPYSSLEDSEGATDPLFLEKAAAVEVARGLAGADGRSALQVTAAGERYFASFAYTGGKVGQSGYYDEQQGMLGRVAGLVYTDDDAKIVLGGNGSYVIKPADASAGSNGASAPFTLSSPPDLRVDDTGTNGGSLSLVSTGAISASHVSQWGIDGAAQWKNLYAEGGYFGIDLTRNGTGLAGSNPNFYGWYGEASWVLTGETRGYDAKRAAFGAPKPAMPFTASPDAGLGALEAAIRYDVLDLNYAENLSTAQGGIRGGKQDVWTFGLNWYPQNAIRFSLNYLLIDVNRKTGSTAPFTDISQQYQAIALRSQISF
jgi:phosphate-selective porin OprO/OprP